MTESSRNAAGRGGRLTAPRPEVLASLTDQHVLAVIGASEVPMSRAEVAETTGLSKPAVSNATARLTERGVLHEVGVRGGRRGGVATLYELDPDHGRSQAVIIQNDRITVQARDLRGTIRFTDSAAVHTEHDRNEIIAATNRLLGAASAEYSAPLLATAVSIADPVDTGAGAPVVLPRSVFPAAAIRPEEDLALAESALIVVDNDVNWATLGEHQEGQLRDCEHFAYIYLGQGLGAGLLLNGQLFRGHRGLAGEIGYLRDGSITGGDITQRLAALGLGSPDAYGIDLQAADAVLSGGSLNTAAQASADELALAIANLAIVMNPQAVALGGPLSRYPAFTAALQERIASLSIDPPEVVISDATPLLGASTAAYRLALREVGFPETPRKAET